MKLFAFQREMKNIGLGIKDEFGRILSLIDFGNVNYWYENDRWDWDGGKLAVGESLNIDIYKLSQFCQRFSYLSKFYYGLDQESQKSIHIISLARKSFGKTHAVTKDIQRIKHYLDPSEEKYNTRFVIYDQKGKYILIPKCNFDVEICIDAIRLIGSYDTLCLFSSDADFIALVKFLKDRGKKVILVKGGRIKAQLSKSPDLIIKAQDIKGDICFIKQKSRR